MNRIVLLVEDDADQRYLLNLRLTRLGYTVRAIADGETAWAIVQHEPITLLITDWMMPLMDGTTLIQHIRAANFPRYIYTILLTVNHTKAAIVRGLDAGADDYIVKPCDSDELRARLAIGVRVLELHERLHLALDQMTHLALYDDLTGLRNRRAITRLAADELVRADRTDGVCSLVLLDIDHFKGVNDQHGHAFGDQVLCAVAAQVTRSVRPYDGVGRWGGEELLLVLPGAAPAAQQIAERVRAAIAALDVPLPSGGALNVTVSLGVASTRGAVALDDLIHDADGALYDAKHAGRNRVCAVVRRQPGALEAAATLC